MSNETLVSDIYKTLAEGVEVPEGVSQEFGSTLAQLITDRLSPKDRVRPFTLRMSNLGKGDRQLWYDSKLPPNGNRFNGQTHLKFMYGEVIEALLLFLAEVSGHPVDYKQAEIEINGIKGHIDGEIGGVTVDVKSASSHGFRKFKNGTLLDEDPFGYTEQIAGYSSARDTDGAFIAMDKVTGELAYLEYGKDTLAQVVNVPERIEHLKAVVASDVPPPRCHDDEPEGQSGNRTLCVQCSYCDHKFECWRDSNGGIGLRTYLYSTGPKHFTNVQREPKGPREITF